MSISGNYGTFLPGLMKAVEKTNGDVLELGMGMFSTPYLHYQCLLANRQLTSYDNDQNWAQFFIDYGYQQPHHHIVVVDDYAKANIDKWWDVVLIDHSPDFRRVIEARRLANLAKYIIIHDSNGRYEKVYHYSEIYPLFKFKTIWDKDARHATVLSNFSDLKDFWK